jgi:hypothetical protein
MLYVYRVPSSSSMPKSNEPQDGRDLEEPVKDARKNAAKHHGYVKVQIVWSSMS